jgi:WhiB family redox-sensing transcriptional regulator
VDESLVLAHNSLKGILLPADGGALDSTHYVDWQESAVCAQTDPEVFFPEKGGSTREAKKICITCPVRQECLEDALVKDEGFGIRGGLSVRERRKLKRQGV